ncbi:outer membrane beta-barrel protein [Marinomonas balearica]|uniref:Outer membrane protein with beta-barrel domain n=1 Tax=Marinomonas balearica TaxID=491947 RepID=A0A4R6M9P7_9GAMM|nr:outer membrane beta-barrel protein [Marinomonas balearica]TDO98144.1 outer membrane protein with beta-barrel domain [Marinomonas balearica]
MLFRLIGKCSGIVLCLFSASGSYAESPWSFNLGFTSLYLDSEAHGFQEEGLDAMALDYAVVYRFNNTVSLKAGMANGIKSFPQTDGGDDLSVNMTYADVQFGYDNGVIRPYFFFGLAEVDVSPESGSSQTSRRLGFGVEHELFDQWSVNVNYSLIAASVKQGESESSTTVGFAYRFD